MQPDSPYRYLSYVTAREIWQEGKIFFVACILFSIFCLVSIFLFNLGLKTLKGAVGPVPQWLWVTAILSIVAWLLRGKSFSFTFPKLTFKTWAIFAVMFAAYMYLARPRWMEVLLLVVVIGRSIVEVLLDSLAVKGRENYQTLYGRADDADARKSFAASKEEEVYNPNEGARGDPGIEKGRNDASHRAANQFWLYTGNEAGIPFSTLEDAKEYVRREYSQSGVYVVDRTGCKVWSSDAHGNETDAVPIPTF